MPIRPTACLNLCQPIILSPYIYDLTAAHSISTPPMTIEQRRLYPWSLLWTVLASETYGLGICSYVGTR